MSLVSYCSKEPHGLPRDYYAQPLSYGSASPNSHDWAKSLYQHAEIVCVSDYRGKISDPLLILKYSPGRENCSIQDSMSYRQPGNIYSATPLFISIIRTLKPVQALLRAPDMTTRLPLLHVRLRPFKLAASHGTAAQCQVLELPHPNRYNPLHPME